MAAKIQKVRKKSQKPLEKEGVIRSDDTDEKKTQLRANFKNILRIHRRKRQLRVLR